MTATGKKVLVTGAAGFLGGHLCRKFALDGHVVSVLVRRSPSKEIQELISGQVFEGDITDESAVARAVRDQETVVHAAANLSYWRAHRDAQWKTNVLGTKCLLGAAASARIGKFVFVSSVAAIGIPGRGQAPADESHAFNLNNSVLHYAISKHAAELACLEAANGGLPVVIVNPSTIFGAHKGSFRGEQLIESVRRRPIVPHYAGGFSVVHISDIVDAIVAATELGQIGHRYILTGENLSYRTACETIARVFGLKRRYIRIPRSATWLLSRVLEPIGARTGRRPLITYEMHYTTGRNQFYDAGKGKHELGFSPRPYADMVREYRTFRQSGEATLYEG